MVCCRFCGSYSKLRELSLSDLLTELTGGICIEICLQDVYTTEPDQLKLLFNFLQACFLDGALLCSSIQTVSRNTMNFWLLRIFKLH